MDPDGFTDAVVDSHGFAHKDGFLDKDGEPDPDMDSDAYFKPNPDPHLHGHLDKDIHVDAGGLR